MNWHQDVRKIFVELMSSDEADIDIALAALLVAAEQSPFINIERQLKRLNHIAEKVRRRLPESPSHHDVIRTLNYVLFEDEKFYANSEDYYNPSNSYLNSVLDTKKGIPITLSIVYIAVASRIDENMEGVNFPGHFLVNFPTPQGNIIIDPYNKGLIRTHADLKTLLKNVARNEISFDSSLLVPVTKKKIIFRLLNNLKQIFQQKRDVETELHMLDRMLIVEPDSIDELKRRGEIYAALKCYTTAVSDFERFISLVPASEEAEKLKREIPLLLSLAKQMN